MGEESAIGGERATLCDSTIPVERAKQLYRTNRGERATPDDSTMIAERAKKRNSTMRQERTTGGDANGNGRRDHR